MSKEIERKASWDVIGTDVKECNNDLDKILKEAKLDYEVEYRPIRVNGIEEDNDRFQAIVRKSDNYVYNIAKKSYTICQNKDAFSIINELKEDVNIVRAGETPSGMIYMIGEMPEVKILGDSFKPNLIFQNSHTSDFALKSAIVPLRIACKNQFSVAFPECKNTQTIKHTSTVNNQIALANQTLLNVSDYMKTFAFKADMYARNKVNANKVVESLFPIESDMSERRIIQIQETRDKFLAIYNNEDNQNFKGTAWGIINAATDFYTHKAVKQGSEANHFINTVLYPEFTNKVIQLVNAA